MSVQENDYIGIGVLTPYPKYDNYAILIMEK